MNKKFEKIYKPDLDLWGLPQKYKGIDFYPIKLKDSETQQLFYDIFQFPKKYHQDRNILKMSYLKYLLYIVGGSISKNKNEDLSEKLIDFLEIVTRQDDIGYQTSVMRTEGKVLDMMDDSTIEILINGTSFTEQDFDIIRAIILKQNGSSIEYVESYDPSLEKLLDFDHNDYGDVTFEDQILTFITLNNLSIHDIYDYTLYQFKKHFIRSVLLLDYSLYGPLEISGQITSKSGKISSRLYEISTP